MDGHISKFTCQQLEQILSQRIQCFYRDRLGHQPANVSCQLFNNNVVIVIEDSLTSSEQVLLKNEQRELAQQVRSDLDKVIQAEIKTLIEEILKVSVIDLLSDATLETGRSATIAVLATVPTASHACFKVEEL